jgi:hypothetical protein
MHISCYVFEESTLRELVQIAMKKPFAQCFDQSAIIHASDALHNLMHARHTCRAAFRSPGDARELEPELFDAQRHLECFAGIYIIGWCAHSEHCTTGAANQQGRPRWAPSSAGSWGLQGGEADWLEGWRSAFDAEEEHRAVGRHCCQQGAIWRHCNGSYRRLQRRVLSDTGGLCCPVIPRIARIPHSTYVPTRKQAPNTENQLWLMAGQ